MALESGNYIGDLIPTNPTSNDPKSQGDDHLRLLKRILQNSFPGIAGSVMAVGTDTGVADAYVMNPTVPLLAYSSGMTVLFRASAVNQTTAPTLNISSLGPIPIKASDGAALVAGDIPANRFISLVYDGASFQLLGVTKRYIDNLVFATVLPNQSGKAGKVLTTNGTDASWLDPTSVVKRLPRTANTQLVVADRGSLVDITSGGNFTQTFAAAATLGSGWWVLIRNSGSSQVTIPASDGRTNWIMYPNECRLFQCDGTAFWSVVIQAYSFVSQISGTFIKPPGYNFHRVRGLGAGQGGGGGGGGGSGLGLPNPTGGGFGGSGGASGASGISAEAVLADVAVPASVPFTVGSGGSGGSGGTGGTGQAAGSSNRGVGSNGGNGAAGSPTTFGTLGTLCYLSAPGGAASANAGQGGGVGNSPGQAVAPAGATTLSVATAGAVVTTYPSTVGGSSTAGGDVTTAAGSAGGNGGVSTMSPATVSTIAGGAGGAGNSSIGVAGNNGASVALTAGVGCGGAGAGGGGGSAGASGSNAATGKGGNGGVGGTGGSGQIEISGIL